MEQIKAPNGLLPVKVKNLGRFSVEGTEIVERCALVASDGTVLCPSITEERAEYLEYLINMKDVEYELLSKAMARERARADIMAKVRLPKQPMQKLDSRQIVQMNDGSFVFEPTKEFQERRRYLKKVFTPIVRTRRKLYPIKEKIETECIFYIKKEPNVKYSLPELIASALEHLVYIGVIKSATDEVVVSTDGSKICYTEKEPYTDVIIRGVN